MRASKIFACHTRLHLGFSAKLRILEVPVCKMEPRSGIIFCKNRPTHRLRNLTRPPSLVLKLIYYHLSSIILAYMFDYCQTWSGGVSERSLQGVCRVFGRCMEDVWKVGGCLEVDQKLFGLPINLDRKICLKPKFFWHFIFQRQNFSGTEFFRPTTFWTKKFLDQSFFWPDF